MIERHALHLLMVCALALVGSPAGAERTIPDSLNVRDEVKASSVIVGGVTVSPEAAAAVFSASNGISNADAEHTHAGMGNSTLKIVEGYGLWPAAANTFDVTLLYKALKGMDVWVSNVDWPRAAINEIADENHYVTGAILARSSAITARDDVVDWVRWEYETTETVTVITDTDGYAIMDPNGNYILADE